MGSAGVFLIYLDYGSGTITPIQLWQTSDNTKQWSSAIVSIGEQDKVFFIYFSAITYGAGTFSL